MIHFLKKEIVLILQAVTYSHPNKDLLFADLNLSSINEYKGTLLVVSHDEYFLKQINV